jgi:heme/copper-type cytochrome/quinol oxidase subunit 4
MDLEVLRTTLWIVAGLLMIGGVAGVGVSLLLDKSAHVEDAEKPAPMRYTQAAAEVAKAPAKPMDPESVAARKAAYRSGIYVFLGLAVLTALEFGIALALEGSAVFLFVVALVKAGLIIQYYMHLNQAWSEEEAH